MQDTISERMLQSLRLPYKLISNIKVFCCDVFYFMLTSMTNFYHVKYRKHILSTLVHQLKVLKELTVIIKLEEFKSALHFGQIKMLYIACN